ncbi:DegT/DnrJ/EryC1/StrS family aminotransferase [Haladaptatus sp. NG-SE-30]
MMGEIPLFEVPWDGREVGNVVSSITRGSHWAKGPYISEFEERIEEFLGVEHVITVNSGTTALVCALKACGVGSGDEVVIPSFTFIATANAVELVGGTPVFADIESETYGLDPDAVHEAISPATKAVVPVHPYGTACDIGAICDVARSENIAVVEDAAETFGAHADGRMLGSFGDIAALSFCQNKVVATGEGGAVVTDDDDFAETIRLYRSHGRASSDYFGSSDSGRYVSVGTNYRMSDLVAAIGCAQLDKVGKLIEGRQQAARRLDDGFEDVDGVEPHSTLTDGNEHVYQLYTVTLGQSIDRDAVIEHLADRNIASKVYWDPPVHQTAYYRQCNAGDEQGSELPVTEAVSARVLSLPMHPLLTREETDRIVGAVEDAVSER